jgi:dephospho-CoA kinase
MNSGRLVVAVAGMPGSGKSLVANVAREKGYSTVIMGDEVREEAKKRMLEPTPDNLKMIMLDLRKAEGEGVMAKRCIPKIEKAYRQKIIIDGVRSLSEVDEFTKHFRNFTLIAIHSSPETRFKRICGRRRSDDPSNLEIFRERDFRELGVGLGGAIAMAEHMLINEGSIETAKNRASEILRRAEEKWKNS